MTINLKPASIFLSNGYKLNEWAPSNKLNFHILLNIDVSFVKYDAIHNFKVYVASPIALANIDQFLISKHRMIVIKEYNPDVLNDVILKILNNCSTDSIEESCEKLTHYFYWEFDGYA